MFSQSSPGFERYPGAVQERPASYAYQQEGPAAPNVAGIKQPSALDEMAQRLTAHAQVLADITNRLRGMINMAIGPEPEPATGLDGKTLSPENKVMALAFLIEEIDRNRRDLSHQITRLERVL